MLRWLNGLWPKRRRSLPNSEGEMAATNNNNPQLSGLGDSPIQNASDDRLGRQHAARAFAKSVLSLDVRRGVVVGVLGPWGSGKTSFINIARAYFESENVTVLDFNPWMFSGAEQLVQSFFSEISAQLKLRPGRLAEVGRRLESYGNIFSGFGGLPIVGPWIKSGTDLAKSISAAIKAKEEGAGANRRKVEEGLRGLEAPILVILDDIDRLNTVEIRDVFKLVRLTASFPNIVYVLAFDRVRVEAALGEQGIVGREYLEKILQWAVDLPAVPDEVLSQQILGSIDEALKGFDDHGPFDKDAWPDVFVEVIGPLVRTMRDVRRYAISVGSTVRDIGNQVALADVLALEAVRTFQPDSFARLSTSVKALTSTSGDGYGRGDEQLKLKIEELTKVDDARVANALKAMIHRLFPAAARHVGGSHYGADWRAEWLKKRRVAHTDILRFYLERVENQGLFAFNSAEKAWAVMSDADVFDRTIRAVEKDRITDVIASLEAYEGDVTLDRVAPGVIVLLNLLPDLPDRDRGLLDLGNRMIVARVVYRLLRGFKPDTVEHVVDEVMPRISTFMAQHELLTIVGHRERAGHKLVSTEAAQRLERAWRDRLRAADPDSLIREPDLLYLLAAAKRDSAEDEPALLVSKYPDIALAILKSGVSVSRSQTMGNRAVKITKHLAWQTLIEVFGNEDEFRQRFSEVEAMRPEGVDELLELARKYQSGWRPSHSD